MILADFDYQRAPTIKPLRKPSILWGDWGREPMINGILETGGYSNVGLGKNKTTRRPLPSATLEKIRQRIIDGIL